MEKENNEKKVIVNAEGIGLRLDVFLVKHFAGVHTRSQITNSIKSGLTILNGEKIKNGYILRFGDVIEFNIESNEIVAEPEDIKLNIVFEDEHLMVINKSRGMVVHPGAGNKTGTLLNGLLFRNRGLERAGIVHRLDKNTAGLMMVAKTAQMQTMLASMFERHDIKRTYWGIIEGKVHKESGTIDANIIRDPKNRTLYKAIDSVSGKGRRAITHYKVLQELSRHSLVRFNLETGRTHQIRVHCKYINRPLIGDPEYNPNSSIAKVGGENLNGQMLESVSLEFIHPITNQIMKFEIEPTEIFKKVLSKVNK